MSRIKIIKPCHEQWDHMQDSPTGKFCEKCAKNVIDFTEKNDEEIQSIFSKAQGKEICGRISSMPLSKMAASFFLISNLTFSQVQTQAKTTAPQERTETKIIKISGKLIFQKTKKYIPNADVFFISKNKYLKTTTDDSGSFSLYVSEDLLRRKNVLYFSFDKVNDEIRRSLDKSTLNEVVGNTYENNFVIFSKDETINNKEFAIESESFYLGGAAIISPSPPDYYYFNGKSISENKFEKLKKENPNYQYFIFDGKIAETISNSDNLNYLHLLFSN